MRKITKLVAAVMALTILLLLLVSCTRKPGLYSWYGRVKVDYILKMTVDAGDGEKPTTFRLTHTEICGFILPRLCRTL